MFVCHGAASASFRPVIFLIQNIILPKLSSLQFSHLVMLMLRKFEPGDYLKFLTEGCFVPSFPQVC